MAEQAQLLPGTLDLLILKAVSLGALHGYGVLLRIEQISRGALRSNRAQSIRRSSGSSAKDCSRLRGARPTTIAAPSSTS